MVSHMHGSTPLRGSLYRGLGHNSEAAAYAQLTQWAYVKQRFTQLLANLAITDAQREAGNISQSAVRSCLNQYYWNSDSNVDNSLLTGSWGKQTPVRPSRDIDILSLLPASVYHRFQSRVSNRQSDLLQEVRSILFDRYSQTILRADRQVICIPFSHILIEVAPGFRCQDGSIITCDTNNGGSYKTSTAEAEQRELSLSDVTWNGNTRALTRMMKMWQRECNVALISFHLERLAIEFLSKWPHSRENAFYHDWMARDFFAFLIQSAGKILTLPGTVETIHLGEDWLSKAKTAHSKAVHACELERGNYEALAGQEWQHIFGSAIPVIV